MPQGVLPFQHIRQLLRSGFIEGVAESYLNPASLDLPCSAECYRLDRTFQVREDETVRSKIKAAGGIPYDLRNLLEVGVSYLIRIEGKFRFPSSVYAYANPKSSTGRVFLLTRVVADRVPMYDALVGPGWKGEAWVLVRPEAFPVIVPPGEALTQIRFFDGKSFLDRLSLEMLLEKPGLFFSPSGKRLHEEGEVRYHGDSFLLSVGLSRGVVGWECLQSSEALDLSQRRSYDPARFFRPVYLRHGKLQLITGGHYILTTFEHLRIPPECAAELRAIDPRFGEFRSHSAGFFDPGWGTQSRGQPITLEITPFENMYLEDGQIIGRVRYERMKEVPTVLYGSANSNYTKQLKGPKLSKHFKNSK